MLKSREQITAEYISRIIPDLTLIDKHNYLDQIRHQRLANIADLVHSATELHFLPNTLRFGEYCDFQSHPDKDYTIILHMIFDHLDVYIDFYLGLAKQSFSVQINNSNLKDSSKDYSANTKKLQQALNAALLKGHKYNN